MLVKIVLGKKLGIAILLAMGFLKMPITGSRDIENQAELSPGTTAERTISRKVHLAKYANTVYVSGIKYTTGKDIGPLATITLRNTTNVTVTEISFELTGTKEKGCSKSYLIKKAVTLKPSHAISISQQLLVGDCNTHKVEKLKIVYTKHVNFYKD